MVSRDPVSLPLAVADTAEELGKIVGVTKNNIMSTIWHDKKAGRDPKYIKVVCDDEGD
jgi:hypothetical protein